MSGDTIAAAASFTLKWKWALTPGWDCIAEQDFLRRSVAQDNTVCILGGLWNESKGMLLFWNTF